MKRNTSVEYEVKPEAKPSIADENTHLDEDEYRQEIQLEEESQQAQTAPEQVQAKPSFLKRYRCLSIVHSTSSERA